MQFTKALQHTIGWKALNTILTFFINLLLVRIMGADGSGDFFYALALLSFFTLVVSWSMEAGITYYGANNLDNIPSITLLILPWLLLQAVVSWLLLDLLAGKIDKHFSFLYVLSNLVIIYFSALYYAKKLFISINAIVCVVNFIVLVGLGWLYTSNENIPAFLKNLIIEKINGSDQLFGDVSTNLSIRQSSYLGAIIYFMGFTLQALVLMIAFFSISKFKSVIRSYQPILARNIFLYSSIAFMSNLLFFLVTRIDYFFVQKYCSEIALSNYVQVSKMGQLLVLLPTIMAGVVFPFSSGIDDKNFLGKIQTLCRLTSLLFVPVAFILLSIGYWLFPWLFGNGFGMMYPAMILYLPGFYCLSLVALLAAHLAGKSILTQNLLASGISLILVIIGDVLLIPNGGIYAAAAVSSVAYSFCLIYLLQVYKRKWGCNPAAFIAIGKSDLHLLLKKFFPGEMSK